MFTIRRQVIDTIKKENFSLKMKVHLLEERLGQLAPEHMEAAVKNNIRLKIEVHSRGAEIKKLKKRISEMEKDAAENKSGSRTEQDSSLVVQLEEELGKKDDEILGLKRQLRESHQSSFSSSSSQPALIHLQEHIEELQKRNAELEAQNERKDHQLDEKEEEIDDLYAQVQQRGGDADRGDVSRRARDLEHRNRELERELDKVDRDRQAAEEDIDILKENCALLQAQLEESEARRRADAEERSFSRAEILEEKQDKEALEQSANEYRDRLAAANIELEERENELDQKNAQCEALIRKLQDKSNDIATLRDHYENARQQVLNHASVLEDEKALRLQLEDELGRARADLDEAAAQWEERLRDSEDQWARREDRLNKELDDRDRKYRRDLAEMLEDKNKKEVAAAALQERLAQREEDIATLQAKLNDLEKESLKLGESHTTDRFALELELERLRRDLARAKEDAERFQKNADERDGRSRERENAIDKLHAENRDLASQLAAQTQARLNLSEKLDSVQSDIKVKETELTDARSRYNELEKQAMKERRLQQSQESEHRDQLTERNTLLLTIYTYLDKILGAEKTPKRGAPNARPITNFSLFHEDLMNRMRAISQITNDFEKRTKTIEQRFVIEFSSLNKRMGDKWKEVDKFEIGLKTLAEKHTALRKKLYVKEGELEAAKMTISEQSAQITHLERSGSGGLGKMTAAELKGVSTRVANLERRNTHMQNIVLKKDEQMTAQAEQSRANEEKWASRVKEYERLRQLDLEKLKQEKQGAKEAMSTMQKEIECTG
ncbi:hypothetical protein FRB99_003428 [Tulasnella sp. 403]|nr:hypothetical protein FRB99_003428 [Tulasnella sp. 403]